MRSTSYDSEMIEADDEEDETSRSNMVVPYKVWKVDEITANKL